MKRILVAVCTFAVALAAEAEPRLGMNLAGPADWMTELPFVDVFRTSRPWISQKNGAGWGQGPELALDESGWVKKLEPGCYAESMLCTIGGGHYPAGTYTVLYEGEGKIDFGKNAKIVEAKPGRILIDVDSSKGGFSVQIKETNPQNHIRNIRVIMPGFEKTWEKEPFHPVFLKRWKGFACFRFMDWMHTNGSTIGKWTDRPTLQHATFSKRGVALEWMIELCNRQQAAPWFCMPHLADDEYVRNFARMVKDRLDPKMKIYIEYSNEVWNGQFKQCQYAGEQGVKLGLGPKDKPWEAGWHYSVRSANPTTARPLGQQWADFQQNPGNWVPESVHAEAATSVRARGGVSEQILYRNTQTGETMWRHRLTDARGRLLDDHAREFYKPRVGEVD